jgi:2'-5' RNA ligase
MTAARLAELGYDELLARAEPFLHLRALDPPTGAMVALVPTAADAARLRVDGGEPADQLHVTLAYLGTAADIPADVQAAVVDRVRSLVEDAITPDFTLPLTADGFALSLFNPSNAERQTCIVLGLSGADLDAVHGLVEDGLGEVAGLVVPVQASPWVAHLTLIYTDNAAMLTELVDRTGPVTFDRLRVAFAEVVTDIPLGGAPVDTVEASYGRAVMSGYPGVRSAAARFLHSLPDLPPAPGASLIQNGQE